MIPENKEIRRGTMSRRIFLCANPKKTIWSRSSAFDVENSAFGHPPYGQVKRHAD